MRGKFHVVESAVWVERIIGVDAVDTEAVLGESEEGIEKRFEVGLATECGRVAGTPKISGVAIRSTAAQRLALARMSSVVFIA
jgi:hypothetical protein